jgi:hypothetical protein
MRVGARCSFKGERTAACVKAISHSLKLLLYEDGRSSKCIKGLEATSLSYRTASNNGLLISSKPCSGEKIMEQCYMGGKKVLTRTTSKYSTRSAFHISRPRGVLATADDSAVASPSHRNTNKVQS